MGSVLSRRVKIIIITQCEVMAKSKGDKQVELSYFYVPDIKETKMLSESEAQHAIRVLRLQTGTLIHITDGQGRLYTGILDGNNPKSATVTDLHLVREELPYRPYLHVAIAPTKNADRIEWTLEKLVEVGVDKVSFVVTDRTIRSRVNMERMERIMVAAVKQSEKLRTVELDMVKGLDEFLKNDESDDKFIAYCGAEYERKELKDCFTKGRSATYLIGPEGDFTPEEVRDAVSAGYEVVSLGRERLRTETAGLYVGMLHQILND